MARATRTKSLSRSKRTASANRASASQKRDWSRVRFLCVAALMAVVWCSLWGRAYSLQVVDTQNLSGRALRQHLTSELVTGRRGKILDRDNRVLASTLAIKSVFVRPYEVESPYTVSVRLANILKVDPKFIRKKIKKGRNFVWIKRKIDDRTAAAIKKQGLKGVYLQTEFGRIYPNKMLTGNLLGYVGVDEKGLAGIEYAFNKTLTGSSSKFVVQRDAAGRRLFLQGAEETTPLQGDDISLTIDSEVQFFAEQAVQYAVNAYDAKWGGAMVVDVASGDILAWAQAPMFNPNVFGQYSSSQRRDHIAQDVLEMGSTIKPFLMAAALEEKIIEPDSLFFCENGKWKLHNVRIRDTKKLQWLTAKKVLSYSSNIGTAKIGLELGATKYRDYLVRLGFGKKAALPLAGQSSGILRPLKNWTQVDLANAAFGQGFASTLPQLAEAYLVLANGGVRKPLRLVKNFPLREEVLKENSQRVFSEETTHTVLKMMQDVVESGTGKSAAISGVSIGGKTGTAQKAARSGGYGSKYTSSFVGLIPALNPEFIILVVVDEPAKNYYGSKVAAPAFKEIAMRYMALNGTLPDFEKSRLLASAIPSTLIPKYGERRFDVGGKPQVSGNSIPDLRGRSIRFAMEVYARQGIIPSVMGSGAFVKKQKPAAGAKWSAGSKQQYTLWLSEQS
ncbi:penicillin-binding transpeptidase domain-containing protein [Halodesulfovibrio aestuarii]|uniref:Cell division protein FtsI (Penicillin-binding protein 3) n=1 Tax=Halodesulfovibrio aestuarii TaxID=126333 RepID=A0A8G2C9Q7_9BACT|nr:penicillin-binding transpeptidase domain-containing protein [Halodesulfovibrio aestuarii]SHJ13575.1 cell division protein FtsI (penicillin-binding protein 3) [Halodesulfovibrio aestuarii]